MNAANENEKTKLTLGGERFLNFSLGEEEYAIPLLSVKEVIALPDITPVPFTPAHFLGIMNLRGQVISVIDLRQKFGIKPKSNTETAVIICDLNPTCLGIVVDSVNSVLSPQASEISEKPEIQSSKNTDYIQGVYRQDKRLVLLLDVTKTLDMEDRKAIQTAIQGK
jgi:purine-binding chemotaxis protein CheW